MDKMDGITFQRNIVLKIFLNIIKYGLNRDSNNLFFS